MSPRPRTTAMLQALRDTAGDVVAAAERCAVTTGSIHQAARRAGVSIVAMKRAARAGATPPDEGEPRVHLTRAEYISLVAQARSAGEVWAQAERIIASLTRNCEDMAARLAAEGGSMMTTGYRRTLFTALAWALLVSLAYGQQEAPNRVAVVQQVADACPGLVLQDHAFTDAVATVLHRDDARWGRNGKRGNTSDPSHDALAFRNPQSRAGGVSIVDIIVGAGGSFATPGWQDVTQVTIDQGTIGAWVAPGGTLPPCLTGGGNSPPGTGPGTPVPTPQPHPPATVDLGPVLAALARIESRLDTLEQLGRAEPALLAAYVDDMVGQGPAGDPALMPNHVTDIKERLDVIRVTLEQLNAWLRSRRALGF